MTYLTFAPKWSRIARLSIVLAAVAGPVCTLAQPHAPSIHHRRPGSGGPVVVAGPAVYSQPPWAGERGDRCRQSRQPGRMGIARGAMGWNLPQSHRPPGLGGPNSVAFGVNFRGHAAGQADTAIADPNGEDFCGSAALGLTHSGNTCAPFLWQDGVMVALPRLRSSGGTEGSNGAALQINDWGMVAGTAENGEVDSTCRGRPCRGRSSSSSRSSG